MFLLPLGLQSRLGKWPLATLLILVVTFAVSIYYFSENALYIRHVRQAMIDSKILKARKDLLATSCSGQFEEETCDYVKSHLTGKDLLDLQDFLHSYQKAFPEASFLHKRKMAKWLADDRLDRKLRDSEFEGTPSYKAFLEARENYLHKSLAQSKQDRLFIRGNATLLASLKALTTHEGWFHLVGNMLIFALFAVFLEQRVGFIGLILLYLIGGLGSNYLQIPFLPMGVRLFGASGAVSAVIGAFAVYFWREKMRCLLSAGFVYHRMISMPAWIYIGLFMALSDLVGVFGSSNSSVAHLAHLTGFGIGFIFAYMQMDLFPLKKSFLFTQEQKLYYQAKELELLEEKLEIYRRIYRLNRESFYSYRALFIYFNKQGFSLTSLSDEDREFITTIIQTCLAFDEQKSEKYDLARETLEMVPLKWDLNSLEINVAPDHITARASQFYMQGDLIQTLRFYDLFFSKYGAHVLYQEIHSEVMRIFDQIEKFELKTKSEILESLLAYAENHPESHFQTQIQQLIHQVHRERKHAAS